MRLVGRTYLEVGRPVTILAQWRTKEQAEKESVISPNIEAVIIGACKNANGTGPRNGPRNVLIRREDGTLVVRPFRGLRRPADTTGEDA